MAYKLYTLEECQRALDYYTRQVKTKAQSPDVLAPKIKIWILNSAIGYAHPRSNDIYISILDAAELATKNNVAPDIFANAVYTSQCEMSESYMTIVYNFVHLLDKLYK